jgi:hypothetical protein
MIGQTELIEPCLGHRGDRRKVDYQQHTFCLTQQRRHHCLSFREGKGGAGSLPDLAHVAPTARKSISWLIAQVH